ncbi:MAG: Do family serine endopeptidase, partial [Bacteroidetes bacterium]|nr:Do family serine endopeptidase [Bacteroidota bacterium]
MKRVVLIFFIAFLGAAFALGVHSIIDKPASEEPFGKKDFQVQLTNFDTANPAISGLADFTYAASVSTPGVVHIKSSFLPKSTGNNGRGDFYNPFRDFFGDEFWDYKSQPFKSQPSQAFGSGVILTSDGYIVTNNHVINGADKIELTLFDNRTLTAELIGTDPSTDLALLKVDEKNLPFLALGNSDNVLVGEWVLAVGNPFNFASTVTAGIISAKGRNLNLLNDKMAIESFIQTDAAVNKGNSGGALVNLNGELIGINTAIATPTGVYAGYAFAVPVNIVRKVVDDLIEFGVVQRGFIGVFIRDINSELGKNLDVSNFRGAYVDSLVDGGAAHAAKIKKGDIILKVENTEILSSSHLQEIIARYRPGDELKVKVNRKGKIKNLMVVLKNSMGNTNTVKKNKTAVLEVLGAEFEELSEAELEKINIDGGVRVKDLKKGKLSKYTYIKEGFIITKVNGRKINNIDELFKALSNKEGTV